jgi:hypothetical protein
MSYSCADFTDTMFILAAEHELPELTRAECIRELGEERDEDDEDQNRRVVALRIEFALRERAHLKDELERASR